MEWTRELPTKEGYYYGRISWASNAKLYRLVWGKDGWDTNPKWELWVDDYDAQVALDSYLKGHGPLEWQGPLEDPKPYARQGEGSMATYRIDNLDVKVRVVLNMLKERGHTVEIEETTFIESDDPIVMGMLDIAGFVSEDQKKAEIRDASNGQEPIATGKRGPKPGTKYKTRQKVAAAKDAKEDKSEIGEVAT